MTERRVGHYVLHERLGAGGMGEVYRAYDLALGRTAALKLIPPGGDDSLRDRLLEEAQHSARLQHPAIATFFDGGTDGGVAWLAMEYVPGETLRARLTRGPLPVSETLHLAIGLLEGLAHAHAANVLHRDIKPENIMLRPDGGVKLLDFGLARAIADQGRSTHVALTGAGVAVGTVGYMAPEQLRGEPVDARTDLFSLAVVLYECLAGRPAFPGDSAVARITAVLTADPPALPPALVPEPVAATVRQGLAREPDRRPPGAGEWLRGFRTLVEDASAPVPLVGPPTLAVTDFEDLAAREDDRWLGSGIAESLGSDLARVPGLQVLARERVLKARAEAGAGADPLAVAQRLGCRWVLAGGFQKLGSRLRITARLADVASGHVVFAEKLDGAADDLFDMQDRLAQQVTAALNLHAPSSAPVRPQLSAWECYARGRDEFRRLDRGAIARARELFEQAVALDANVAAAHAGLAGIYAMSYTFTSDPAMLRRAIRHADDAIAVDPEVSDAYTWRGYARWRLGDAEAGLADERQATAIDPARDKAHYFEGAILLERGRPAEAIAPLQRCLQYAPSYTYAWLVLGWAHLDCGHLDEAAWCFSTGRDLEGTAPDAHTVGSGAMLGEVYRRRGMPDEGYREALAALERVESGDHMYRDSQRVLCLLVIGRNLLDAFRPEAAATAFQQVVAHVRARPTTLGGGWFVVQALAGLARATGDREFLDHAADLLARRAQFDYAWGWSATLSEALIELAQAALATGERERAGQWLADARRAGATPARLDPVEQSLARAV